MNIGPKISAPPLRVQAFSPPATAADLADLERQIASLELETSHNAEVIRELDMGLLASLKRALEARIIVPPELLPPPPPILWLAVVSEHRAFFSSSIIDPSRDPEDVGEPTQDRTMRERDPDYYSARVIGGRQEIRARFCEVLASGLVREAARRQSSDLTVVFKHRPNTEIPWNEDIYSDWDGMLAAAHSKFTPGHDLELRFKRLAPSGRVVSFFHPLRLCAARSTP